MRLIKNYIIQNKVTFIVELAYDSNGNSVIKGMRKIPRRRYNEQVNLKGLHRLINKKIPIYALIETREGIFPLALCIKRRMGGNLVF